MDRTPASPIEPQQEKTASEPESRRQRLGSLHNGNSSVYKPPLIIALPLLGQTISLGKNGDNFIVNVDLEEQKVEIPDKR